MSGLVDRADALLRVGMFQLGMVGLVEDQQIDLIHCDEGMGEALVKHFSSANDDHVFRKVFEPHIFRP